MLGLITSPAFDRQNERPMKTEPFSAKKSCGTGAPILLALALLLGFSSAQTSSKASEKRNTAPANTPGNVEQELVRLETGFFEAWKMLDQSYFREHMAENGIAWGVNGTLSRDQLLAALQASAKTCIVDGYNLSDFGALPLASGTYLLTYKVQQYATCNGEKLPVNINGSSVYMLKAGHWQAVYRAQVPMKNQ